MAYASPHREAHPSFPQPDEGQVKVWRYLDLPRYIWMLSTCALAFARVDGLEDPFEGSVPQEIYEAWKADPENRELIASAQQGLRKHAFVSCWHANDVESEAMWRLYCGSKDGIALQTTYEKLDASLPAHVYLGLVHYVDYDRDTQAPRDPLGLLMRKRQPFEHEHEVRALIWPSHTGVEAGRRNNVVPGTDADVVKVPWSADRHLEQIYVSPYAEDWYREVVKAVTEKFAPSLVDRLTWSHMRGIPLY